MAEKDPKRWDEIIIDSPFAKLTKRDVHEYYSTPTIQQAILDAVGNREALIRQNFTADKTVLRRKDSGGSFIRLDPGTLDQWNERRLSEVHPTFGRKTDVLLADIDPQEGVDWRRTKKITETVAKTLQSHPSVRDVSVRYSGGRGFYVEGKLDSPVGIDRARNLTKQILDGLAQRHDVFFEPVGPGKIRLDTTPLKFRGSIRAPYSINADTGLVSAPVKIEELGSVQKQDFSVAKVLERMREKKAAQMSFPQPELKDLWMRLEKNKPIITTRIEQEHNRYNVGDVVTSPLGKLRVTARESLDDVAKHPFHKELTAKQTALLRGKPYDVLTLEREKKAANQLPQSLLDEVSKDKWATRAYGQKTLREIKEGKREVTPIVDKGKTVGFMSPTKTPLGYPSTGFVFVSPASRGKGLAAKVLAEYAKKNPKAISFIHRDNIPSQKAHEKAGWENSGVLAKGNKKALVWRVKKAMGAKQAFEIPFNQIAMVLDDSPVYYHQYLAQQRAHQQKALNAAQQQVQPQLNQFGLSAQNMFAAKTGSATEFAPGIPMNRKIHKIPTSTTPQTWTLAIQKHDADRAGTHFDLRLVPPQGGRAHSWAIPKAKLPEKGKMQLAVQQPTHTANYAKNFTGTIPKGTYGSGQVDMHLKEPVKILTSGDNKVKFQRDNGEQYTLFRTKDKNWGITKSGSQVIDEWRKKKRAEKATAFIRERMR